MEHNFFLVWREGGIPTKRHLDEAAAIKEAQRLAAKNPGTEYFVLQAITKSVKTEVQTVRLYDLDSCGPF